LSSPFLGRPSAIAVRPSGVAGILHNVIDL
jgi:hypothetical protein